MTVSIRPSIEEDIATVAANLRADDVEEVLAQGYASAEAALSASYNDSTVRFTLAKNGRPIAMFGLCPTTILGNKAQMWMLGTNEICSVKKSFCRYSLKVIKYFASQYPILSAQVDGRYIKAHRWLEWMGAIKGKPYKLNSGIEFNDFFFTVGA